MTTAHPAVYAPSRFQWIHSTRLPVILTSLLVIGMPRGVHQRAAHLARQSATGQEHRDAGPTGAAGPRGAPGAAPLRNTNGLER